MGNVLRFDIRRGRFIRAGVIRIVMVPRPKTRLPIGMVKKNRSLLYL